MIIELIVIYGVLCILAVFGKWVFAAFSILTGDKELIKDFGNLCDDYSPAPGQVYWLDKWDRSQGQYGPPNSQPYNKRK